jgi:DNA (cytosine-5)-methyltransferase 1
MEGNHVLSLFPGLGLLDAAFEIEGFCVVRGPDPLWGGDVRKFHPPPGVYGGVIGGPPCQAFSQLRHIVEANGHQTAQNLIPEFERVVLEAQPGWFLMENVPAAPLPYVDGYRVSSLVVDNRDCGGIQSRKRRWSFGTHNRRSLDFGEDVFTLEAAEWVPAVVCDARSTPVAIGGSGKRKGRSSLGSISIAEMCRRQGLPEDWLDDCPLTESGKRKALGNGVPLPMGLMLARAVRRTIGGTE